MKRITLALALILFCFFCACSNNSEEAKIVNGDKAMGSINRLVPSEGGTSKETLPSSAFTGTFANDYCTATVEIDGDEMVFRIATNEKTDNTYREWLMKGYFSEETGRVNYSNAVKYLITCNKRGDEIQRQVEYDYGSGRMQFDGPDRLVWTNNTELPEGGSELTRKS